MTNKTVTNKSVTKKNRNYQRKANAKNNAPKQNDSNSTAGDPILQYCKNLGIPLAIVTIGCLWLGNMLEMPQMGTLFMLLLPISLLIGFVYNIRLLMLSIRRRRQQS